MKKPLIGLTAANLPTPDWDGRLQLDRDGQGRLYCEAVALAGGLPLVLPLVRAPLAADHGPETRCGHGHLLDNAKVYLEALDGLILSGGGDLAPPPGAANLEFYQQTDRSRDIWESALLAAALALDKPVLGICRGLQLLNVALGGTLWADLPTQRPGPVAHRQTWPRSRGSHPVTLEAGSKLAGILQFPAITVNSGHHQGVTTPAPSLAVAARAEDGLIEALEHREARFVLGVQWHPEGQLAEAHSRSLFRAFIQASSLRKEIS
ncbi:MAG: gamma-glutamyl-gamma-aminobutyrate hydrolase family protein [Candidatus Adiutrix sp.]|nr:gamma-glutamyl-gamma-aminobutyrate hydrolase family protein [Candidatus Adiutrix sp.]